MKKFIPFLLLALAACASHPQKMTSAEVQKLYKEVPSFQTLLSNNSDDRIKTTTVTRENRKHYRIDCYGTVTEPTCWKTEVSLQEYDEHLNEFVNPKIAGLSAEQYLEQCQSKAGSLDQIRNSCFDYIHLMGHKLSDSEIQSARNVLKMLCDLDGVRCIRNAVKFGKGEIVIEGRHKNIRFGTFQISGNKEKDSYRFDVLRE